jgi:hypothetical protein
VKLRTFFWLAAGCGAVVAMALLTSFPGVWDGDWPPQEYSFTFRDGEGRPVEGVQLRVENEAGTTFYHFPVADYLPGRVPTSDARGVLVFHHAPKSGVSGTAYLVFGVVYVETDPGPVYVYRFLIDDHEVHRVRNIDLSYLGERKVKRQWRWLTSAEVRDQVLGGKEPDWTRIAWDPAVFDLNGDGRVDRTETYAARAASWASDRAWEISVGEKPASEELEFGLVERTVIINRP